MCHLWSWKYGVDQIHHGISHIWIESLSIVLSLMEPFTQYFCPTVLWSYLRLFHLSPVSSLSTINSKPFYVHWLLWKHGAKIPLRNCFISNPHALMKRPFLFPGPPTVGGSFTDSYDDVKDWTDTLQSPTWKPSLGSWIELANKEDCPWSVTL